MHSWDISPKEAVVIQKELAGRIISTGMPDDIKYITGCDIAFHKESRRGFCSVLLFNYPDLSIMDTVHITDMVKFPYIPGLLSFREGPLIIKTLSGLSVKPSVIICDGQGIAHPRGLGLASHIGLFMNTPSIGCAKSKLYGSYKEPGMLKGSREYLYGDDGRAIGTVLRTRDNVKPVFVSPGHLMGIDESADLILKCTGKYRIPEPVRQADIEVGRYKRSMLDRF